MIWAVLSRPADILACIGLVTVIVGTVWLTRKFRRRG